MTGAQKHDLHFVGFNSFNVVLLAALRRRHFYHAVNYLSKILAACHFGISLIFNDVTVFPTCFHLFLKK